jgi:hypothetical protein
MTERGLFCGIAAALVLALPGSVPAQQPDPFAQPIEVPLQRFPACCPRPEWWEAAGPVPHARDMKAFLDLWQNRSLSDEQKAKALFQVIEDHHRSNDDLTAAAITYYPSVDRNYPYMRALLEFGVSRYLDHDRSLENYSGKTGDLSAGMVRKLAGIYIAEGEPGRAIPITQHILGPRRGEVNDHLLEFNAMALAEALGRTGREPEAVAVLLAAKSDFEGDWEERIDDQLARLRGDMGLAYYLHDKRISGPVLLALLVVLLVVGIFWRRQPRIR